MADKGLKKAVVIGAAIGALFSLFIALFLDSLLSGTVQGTWWDAAAKDVTRMFGPECGRNAFAVGLMLAFVMAFLAGFGAILGAAGGLIMNRFFKNVLKL
jgi:large-conductance mechanosensitive channel